MTDQQEREHWRWVGDWCTATASLLFLWDNRYGTQPVLMPGLTYYWWIEEETHDTGTVRIH